MTDLGTIHTFRTATAPALAARVEERRIGPCRVLMLQTPVREVVSWSGFFMAYPDVAAGDLLVQALTVQMLDKGTRHRDRFAIAEVLEDRGAQIQFLADSIRVSFQGRALRDDLPEVLGTVAEQLREPLFDAAEFEKARVQYKASVQRSLESTATQAGAALAQRFYSPAHPNYMPPFTETLAQLDALTVEPLRAYHARHFGARDLVVVFVGDVDAALIEQVVHEAFGDWTPHDAPAAFDAAVRFPEPERYGVFIPDRLNLDVRMGHGLALRRNDADYIPLYIASYILGGNFSARLMNKVRDELGLTYGIYGRLAGITAEYEGHWNVGVTLSQENVETGIAATLDEVRRFVQDGPTADELQRVKTTITGAYKVGLSTTGRIAGTLARHAVLGLDVAYLDRFTHEVEAATLDQVRDAAQRHFKPDRFQIALAGTLPEAEADLR